MLNRNGKCNSDGSFDWKDAVLDAGISAGLTFFTSLGGVSLIGGNAQEAVLVAVIAAGGQFFLTLAIKRGLKEKVEK